MKQDLEYSPTLHVLLYPVSRSFASIVKFRKNHTTKHIPYYSRFFDKLPSVAKMRAGAKGWKGVEAIYSWEQPRGLAGRLENFWMTARNCQALRNRLRIVIKVLRAHIEQLRKQGVTSIHILSLAAGSGKSVLTAAANSDDIVITSIDSDESAGAASKKLAQELNVQNITWHHGDVFDLHILPKGYKADIVEIIGLHEYLTDEQSIRLCKSLLPYMKSDGVLVTSQTHKNPESAIVTQIVDWEMIYRSPKEFTELLEAAGFTQTTLHTEPHAIQSVAFSSIK